jgi:hypothetical protein
MIRATFKDIYNTEISVQESGSGYFRLDFVGEEFKPKLDKVSGHEITKCISLSGNEARVLQSCLNSYFDENE